MKLNELLVQNQDIRTRVSNYPDWILNKVIKIENDLIHIEFITEYLKLLLTVGDAINIKTDHNDIEYVLTGFVENVVFSSPSKVIVRIQNIISHQNLRKFIRRNTNLLCKIIPSNEEFKIQGITTDISEGGIAMISYADFNIKDKVEVEIITMRNELLSFKGIIKRLDAKVNNHVQYGIEIVDIDDENKSILSRIISELKIHVD